VTSAAYDPCLTLKLPPPLPEMSVDEMSVDEVS